MSASAAVTGGTRRAAGTDRLLPPDLARLSAFSALVLFAGLHWFVMAPPRGSDPKLGIIGLGIGLAVVLALWVPTLPPRARRPVALALALGVSMLALVTAGLPAKLLAPNHWDEFAAGLGRGFDTLPQVNVPYNGLNDWTHLIILLGGALLVTLSAAVAFWPGARERARLTALVLLVTLYATPSVEITFSSQYLRGVGLALLVMAFLWLDRVPSAGARIAGAGAALAALAALVVAPAVDGNKPWIDYEHIASSVGRGKSAAFSWDHTYGPLLWPREGAEVLRVKAKRPTYWKAESLEEFDGVRWTSPHTGWQPGELGEGVFIRPKYIQTVRMLVRGMSSDDFLGAGTTLEILDAPALATPLPIGGVGQWRSDRPLRRGDTWAARVYTPDPSAAQLRESGTGTGVEERYLTVTVPAASALKEPAPLQGAPRDPVPLATVHFPVLGGDSTDALVEPGPVLMREILTGGPATNVNDPGYLRSVMDRSAYGRAYDLALRLRGEAATSYDYVKAVQRYLTRGFEYDEIVPRHPVPLESFLFTDRRGYCQQFSGAMALLLRMGGVPARVATGFTPGSRDKSTGEYVVRDVDAHSWVEAWFPGWGWVPFDPTPAAAPARSQAGSHSASAATGDTRDVNKGNDSVDVSGSSGAGLSSDSNGWLVPAMLIGGALALLALLALRLRRRAGEHHPDRLIADLERALRRAGHSVGPSDTLRALERRVSVSSGAVSYLRSVAAARYGGGALRPTAGQRRALRGALGHGLGPVGRLRSWWAVPPRLPSLRRPLH